MTPPPALDYASDMKRSRAPLVTPPDRPSRLEAIGRGWLALHLFVTPLAFSQATVESFEFVKLLVLISSVIGFIVLGTLSATRLSITRLKLELRQPLTAAGLICVGAMGIATLASISPTTSFYGFHENFAGFVTMLALYVLFLSARWLVRTPEQMAAQFGAIAYAAILVTLYGFFQILGFDPFNWNDPSRIGNWVRPFSTFGNANYLGAYFVLAIPLVVWLALRCSRINRNSLIVLATAMTVLTVLTLSRAAWLGLMASAATVLAFWWKGERRVTGRQLLYLTVGAIVVGLTGFLVPGIHDRVRGFLDSAGRFAIWENSWRIFLERPWTGCGPDTFQQVYGRHGGIAYWKIYWGVTPSRAHNEFLHVLVTQGLVGFIACLGLVAAIGISFRRAWIFSSNDRTLVLAIFAAFIGYFVTELFGFTVIACGSLAAVGLAMISRLAEPPVPVAVYPANQVATVSWRAVQAAILAGCAFLLVHLVIDPWRAETLTREADLRAHSRPDKALELNEKAVHLCPWNPFYQSCMAMRAGEMARLEMDPVAKRRLSELARQGFEAAVKLEPQYGFHHAGLGRVLLDLAELGEDHPELLDKVFDTALRLDPADANTYADAIQAAFFNADAPRAKRILEDGLRLYPNYGPLKMQRVRYLLMTDRFDETRAAFREAFDADWTNVAKEKTELNLLHNAYLRRIQQLEHAKSVRNGGY
ncbi:MAG: O-antigen ligase family protein [Planctomycetes bacterium]|nr:O-antigen ligase family protein [Planctomycetota bacterium]